MHTLAILPVKSFDKAKQRLAPGLSAGARRALAEAMFSDVLTALRRTSGVDEILIVSADHGAQRMAGGYGARVLDDDAEDGQSLAAGLGIDEAVRLGCERVLLVPGDCPALVPRELDALLAARPAHSAQAVIVPDRHGTGTNALLLSPPGALIPAFGPGSLQRHRDRAATAGVEHEVADVPSLALDVDTPEDLEALRAALAAQRGGAAHTRGMLTQLGRSVASTAP